ncbi:MAG: hypothetical protein IKG22_04210, partial [Atopobiaceae bacterium]|nr:hypothetical protein [Atopobiaceae bacterium]
MSRVLSHQHPLTLFCRASAARATARRCSLGVGRIEPSSAAVRGSGKPRGERVPRTPTSDGLRSACARGLALPFRSPLARSATGSVLSPPYAAAWPTGRVIGARGQRATCPASGAH